MYHPPAVRVSAVHSAGPLGSPSLMPSLGPSSAPSSQSSSDPSVAPSEQPTKSTPSVLPSVGPSSAPFTSPRFPAGKWLSKNMQYCCCLLLAAAADGISSCCCGVILAWSTTIRHFSPYRLAYSKGPVRVTAGGAVAVVSLVDDALGICGLCVQP